ncbi:OmpA family protein [Hwanghaeella grinnelliae]|uniref:OmpA family protein n=1 Tax=Hwanghaeella grinnelliae TaxID=2500179 RepID=A0A3S2ZAU7_9PROT|nr:OmpA family protein [Hwanghaeella grinnelliae]RVU39486.1 OmpA family protein [Hwanghaeella grinnelliae]
MTIESSEPLLGGIDCRFLVRFAAAAAVALTLSACETMSDIGDTAGDVASAANPLNWFGDDEGDAEESTEPKPVPGASDAYPSVGTVPQKPPPPSIVQEAGQLQNQLVADKNNARYSEQVVRQNTGGSQTTTSAPSPVPQAAAAPPQPVAQPAPQPAAVPQPVPQPTASNQVAAAPPQPAPAPSAGYGHPIGQAVHIATLYFPQGGSQLTQTDLNVLSQVASIFRNGGKSIKVVGHASKSAGVNDQVRQDLVNYKASLDRATSAAAALLRIGVPQDKIDIAAVGAREPRYSEDSSAGISGNQRVELFIQY